MSCSSDRLRVAVAEETVTEELALHLGRATKFAVFDVREGRVRGPFFRVRHMDPGGNCDGQEELARLLQDCDAVLARSAGRRLSERLAEFGVEVVATDELGRPWEMVMRFAQSALRRRELAETASVKGV